MLRTVATACRRTTLIRARRPAAAAAASLASTMPPQVLSTQWPSSAALLHHPRTPIGSVAPPFRSLFSNREPPDTSVYPTHVNHVVKPNAQDEWVSDAGNLLADDAAVARINAKISSLKKETGTECAVVVVKDLGSAVHKVAGRAGDTSVYRYFADSLFNFWGIGRCDHNDGILLALFVEGRSIQTIVGKGLSHAPSLKSLGLLHMQQTIMIPHLKQGDHSQAVEQGVSYLVDAVKREHSLAAATDNGGGTGASVQHRSQQNSSGSYQDNNNNSDNHGSGGPNQGNGDILFVVGIFLASIFLATLKPNKRCEECESKLQNISNNDESRIMTLLSDGEQKERQIGSVEFTLSYCPQCHKVVQKKRKTKYVANISLCPGCGYRTYQTSHRELVSPTYSKEGTDSVEETCCHCGRHRQYQETIPKKEFPKQEYIHRTNTTGKSSRCSSSSGGSGWRWSSSSSGSSSSSSGGRSWSSSSSGSGSRSSGGGFGGGSSRGGSSAGSSW